MREQSQDTYFDKWRRYEYRAMTSSSGELDSNIRDKTLIKSELWWVLSVLDFLVTIFGRVPLKE